MFSFLENNVSVYRICYWSIYTKQVHTVLSYVNGKRLFPFIESVIGTSSQVHIINKMADDETKGYWKSKFCHHLFSVLMGKDCFRL